LSLISELKRRNVFRVSAAYVILAWLVLQVADVILNNIAAPGWVFGALLLFLAAGLPFVVFFAWAFELTPEGLKRESEVDRSKSITPQTGRKLDRVIIIVLLLALGYFAYDKFLLQRGQDAPGAATQQAAQQPSATAPAAAAAPPTADHSIAVLPFVNISDDPGNEYFSDGLSEELLNLLAKIPELRVAARTSSFSFKGQQLEIPEIAARLKVANILEGSVRKAGNQVRITAQLIKADDGFHLWSETYDRTLDNIFVVQDEIAAAVVNALKISLLGAAPLAKETNAEAYALYLQARYLFNQRSRDNYEKSARAYRQALALDPDYAAAWAGLSSVTINQAGYNYIDLDPGVQQAREAAERAIQLDPQLADGWASLARVEGNYEFNWDGAYQSVQKALALAPANSEVLAQAASVAASLGHHAQALAYAEKAVDLDPVNYGALSFLSGAYEQVDQLEQAEKTMRHLLTLNPDYVSAQSSLAYVLLRQGRAEDALVEVEKEPEAFWRSLLRAVILHTLGRKADADAELASYVRDYHAFGAYQIAEIYAWRNQPDEAFEWLEKAYQQRDPGIGALLNDTAISNLYRDPRWEPLLQKVGLLDAWQAMPAGH
jgi:adenylate cyclase